jgi:hypothetical protein
LASLTKRCRPDLTIFTAVKSSENHQAANRIEAIDPRVLREPAKNDPNTTAAIVR